MARTTRLAWSCATARRMETAVLLVGCSRNVRIDFAARWRARRRLAVHRAQVASLAQQRDKAPISIAVEATAAAGLDRSAEERRAALPSDRHWVGTWAAAPAPAE